MPTCWGMAVKTWSKSLFSIIKPVCFYISRILCMYSKNTATQNQSSGIWGNMFQAVLIGIVCHDGIVLKVSVSCAQNQGFVKSWNATLMNIANNTSDLERVWLYIHFLIVCFLVYYFTIPTFSCISPSVKAYSIRSWVPFAENCILKTLWWTTSLKDSQGSGNMVTSIREDW